MQRNLFEAPNPVSSFNEHAIETDLDGGRIDAFKSGEVNAFTLYPLIRTVGTLIVSAALIQAPETPPTFRCIGDDIYRVTVNDGREVGRVTIWEYDKCPPKPMRVHSWKPNDLGRHRRH